MTATDERFGWGVGFASTQAEGAAELSDWRDWERQGRAPFSADGNGFGTDHRGDLRLFAEAGLTDVRLCPEWARLEPENGRVDPWAVEHYRSEVSDLIAGTVERWDAETTARKVELQVGRDLQFIRINGTIVGGLAGLVIYTVSQQLF